MSGEEDDEALAASSSEEEEEDEDQVAGDRGEEGDGSLSGSEGSEEEEMLRCAVADVPFELLQKAKAEGHSKIARGKTKADLKRLNKNRPMEISSKKPVGRFRDVMQTSKRVIRDPRFESLCGDYDESRFKKAYNFIYDEQLPAERQELFKSLKKAKDPELISEKKNEISLMERQLQSERDRRKHAEKAAEQKRMERELVKQGKKPFYMKKSDKRRAALIEKYKELKTCGKLENFLAKRRQKNAAKDHRYVPYRR
ncbi:ribosomal RNA processing protein 36 homolog [Selaginella moellendorffii]|uniref:ribosomal RNA processing protein 36 homolog n=1 Tax=Selaginella moellendorffii TaxID=88036 RepID=UPI000D1C489E|nr:ribosomal RNA processing protein 36 homolog [Selaginella moellendorffii]|eukprot:XP_002983697.2 ribosomal RNA processing protein 36 homolog [Selaginella moellendorffii]